MNNTNKTSLQKAPDRLEKANQGFKELLNAIDDITETHPQVATFYLNKVGRLHQRKINQLRS